jgi:hypothetical protein
MFTLETGFWASIHILNHPIRRMRKADVEGLKVSLTWGWELWAKPGSEHKG